MLQNLSKVRHCDSGRCLSEVIQFLALKSRFYLCLLFFMILKISDRCLDVIALCIIVYLIPNTVEAI